MKLQDSFWYLSLVTLSNLSRTGVVSETPSEALALQQSRTVRRLWIGIKCGFCIQNVRNNTLIPLWSTLKSARYKICKVAENLNYVSRAAEGFVCAFNPEHEQGVLMTFCAKSVPWDKSERWEFLLYSNNFITPEHNTYINCCASEEQNLRTSRVPFCDFHSGIPSILLKTNIGCSFGDVLDFLYLPPSITRLLEVDFNHVLHTFFILFHLWDSFQQNGLLGNPTVWLWRKEHTWITQQLCIQRNWERWELNSLLRYGWDLW